jgi:hypothetical protein
MRCGLEDFFVYQKLPRPCRLQRRQLAGVLGAGVECSLE